MADDDPGRIIEGPPEGTVSGKHKKLFQHKEIRPFIGRMEKFSLLTKQKRGPDQIRRRKTSFAECGIFNPCGNSVIPGTAESLLMNRRIPVHPLHAEKEIVQTLFVHLPDPGGRSPDGDFLFPKRKSSFKGLKTQTDSIGIRRRRERGRLHCDLHEAERMDFHRPETHRPSPGTHLLPGGTHAADLLKLQQDPDRRVPFRKEFKMGGRLLRELQKKRDRISGWNHHGLSTQKDRFPKRETKAEIPQATIRQRREIQK